MVREVLGGTRTLRLSRLFPHLPQDGRVQIITTNYDRLIELAAELSGFKVDTKSFGLYYAPFSKTAGSYAYCDHIEWVGKAHRKVERKVVSIYKPHGSLDWTVVQRNYDQVRLSHRARPLPDHYARAKQVSRRL